jgi:hypothetical protein
MTPEDKKHQEHVAEMDALWEKHFGSFDYEDFDPRDFEDGEDDLAFVVILDKDTVLRFRF